MALKANTWYEGVLSIDGTLPANSSESYNPRFRVAVWERDNPNMWAQNRTQFATGWNGKEWYFFAQVKSGTVDIEYEQEYDDGAIGQRSKMIDGSGNTEWVYTSRGKVQSEKKTIGSDVFLTQYGYHPDGSVRWMQYPGGNASQAGEKLEFTYLPQKALESVFSSTNNYLYLQKATYDAAGRVDVRSLGAPNLASNPLLMTDLEYFGWDQQGGRLKTLKTGIPTNLTSLQNFEYDYDPVGNIDWIKDFKAGGTQTQSFGYDSLDRLISAQASGGMGGTYDPFTYAFSATTGNLTGKEGTTLSYNASVSCPAGTRSIPHAASSFGSTTYSYDCNGNQVSKTASGTTQTRSFDAENRLVGVSGTATASFIYDGDGQRVKGTVGSTTTVYLGAFFEWTGSTSSMKRYYYAGSIRIAIRVGNGSGTTGISWLFGDHLGSTSLAVDMNAVRTGEHRYRPYGENRLTYLSLPTTFDFTGQRVETSLGLHFFQARWYDSKLGRFISADSIIPKTGGVLAWDRYQFVLGNPLKYTDPSGHEICMDDGNCEKKITAQSVLLRYGVVLKGEWSNRDQISVLRAVTTVGLRFGAELGMDSYSAFKEVYNITHSDPFVFQYGGCKECNGTGGATYSARLVKFASLSSRSDQRRVNNVIHELGHAFNSALMTPLGEDHMPYSVLDNYWDTHDWPRRSTPYTSSDGKYYGLAGPRNERVWHQNPTGSAGEEFADTFLAWATNSWDARGGTLSTQAQTRFDFMNKYMPIWLGIARNW